MILASCLDLLVLTLDDFKSCLDLLVLTLDDFSSCLGLLVLTLDEFSSCLDLLVFSCNKNLLIYFAFQSFAFEDLTKIFGKRVVVFLS